MKRFLSLASILAGTLAAHSAATAKKPLVVAVPDKPLIAQSSCDEARDRVLDWAAWSAVESRFGHHYYLRGGAVDGAVAAPTSEGEGKSATTSGPGHYTGTNVQERGVDEADMVKTDGKYVYSVSGREVVIVKSWPADRAHVVARYELPAQVTPQQLFLRGDRLVVLSYVYEPATARKVGRIANPWGQHEHFYGTRITVLDIGNRARPRIDHEADIEGYTGQARMIGDDVYLVSNASMNIPVKILASAGNKAEELANKIGKDDWDKLQKAREGAYRTVRAHLERNHASASLNAAMPRQRHASAGGKMGALRPMYGCQDLLVPPGGSQLGTLNIVHFDVDRPRDLEAIGLMASGWNVYASNDALYAAMPNYGWHHFWGFGPQPASGEYNTTWIHKFDLRGEKPRYAATGRVRGHILNQFSMSEHRGNLRVATTDQGWGGGGERVETGNHLYVMATRGNRLRQIGAIEDLAVGERIYSARMMGDKGYMVTFRQTDPLYTFDLSDPERPRVVGELKINGFSSYIHPLDDDHLLTIGQDADEDGRVLGAHLQIFDVSNPAKPRRTAHRRLADKDGWSYSAAQWDHHAFTYDPQSGVLGIPMSSWSSDPEKTFLGLILLQVSTNGFEQLGRINHTGLARSMREQECAVATTENNWQCEQGVNQDWRSQIQRSIVMDDTLFTISQLGLQANRIAQPGKTLARVLFPRKPVAVAR